jgi:hypothetical protein
MNHTEIRPGLYGCYWELQTCSSARLDKMASLQLQARAGDVQALKSCIAAATSSTEMTVTTVAGADTPTSLFGTPSICLSTPEGLKLTEPNAAALYASGWYPSIHVPGSTLLPHIKLVAGSSYSQL